MADAKQTSAEKQTAAKRYGDLKSNRKEAETRAKRCAKVTLPRLWVDEGAKSRTPGSAYIDTGPKCVNALASKIVLAWLPPNASVFKLAPDQAVAENIAEQAGVETSELEAALVDVERVIVNDLETSGVRPVLSEAAKHAIVLGNFLLYDPDEGKPKLYPLTSYVTDRDGLGNVLEIITLDKIAPAMLPDSIRAAVMQKLAQERDEKTKNDDVNLYTWVRRSEDGKEWEVVQEVEGVEVPETVGTYPIDACPWIPLCAPPSSWTTTARAWSTTTWARSSRWRRCARRSVRVPPRWRRSSCSSSRPRRSASASSPRPSPARCCVARPAT